MKRVTFGEVRNYLKLLYQEFPGLHIYRAKPWWLRFVFNLPLIKRLGWEDYTQTIGMNIYLSDQWDGISATSQLSTLRHERQHLLQFKKYGFFLMAILYLFVFFPIGLAYFRAKFEREGFFESMKTRVEFRGSDEEIRRQCFDMYNEAFLSSKYLWAWPFKTTIVNWFNEDWDKATRR